MDTITKAVVAAAGVLVWKSKVHTAQCIEVSCNVECSGVHCPEVNLHGSIRERV